MKTKLITLAVLLLAVCTLRAQTFGGPLTFYGQTNAPLYIGGVIPTNSAVFYVPAKTIYLGSINTNETAILSYGAIIMGQGYTNYVPVNLTTNLFNSTNGWVNGSTFTDSVPAQSLNVQVVPYAQIQLISNGVVVTTFTNTIQGN